MVGPLNGLGRLLRKPLPRSRTPRILLPLSLRERALADNGGDCSNPPTGCDCSPATVRRPVGAGERSAFSVRQKKLAERMSSERLSAEVHGHSEIPINLSIFQNA